MTRGRRRLRRCGAAGAPPLRAERGCAARLGLCWVSPLIARGAARQLAAADLFALPADLRPAACAAALWREWTEVAPLRIG